MNITRKTFFILCSFLISFSAFSQQKQPKAGDTCTVNGKKGTVTIEEGNNHRWCKVGNRESECGGKGVVCVKKAQAALSAPKANISKFDAQPIVNKKSKP